MVRYLSVLLLAVIVSSCSDYQRYSPVYLADDHFKHSHDTVPLELRKNIKVVLKFYEVPFRVDDDGNVWIPREVAEDEQLLWTYTVKASDPNWISEHR
jgi:hypothetical protein